MKKKTASKSKSQPKSRPKSKAKSAKPNAKAKSQTKSQTKSKAKSTAKSTGGGSSPSERLDARIAELDDWRGEMLSRVRALMKEAVPNVVEEWKWMGTPVWECNGIICTGESYKDKVKLTFAKGASLKDPFHLFNSSLDGNVRRAIDIFETTKLNEKALKALIQEAVALNETKPKKARR